jgi:hypothetical protein
MSTRFIDILDKTLQAVASQASAEATSSGQQERAMPIAIEVETPPTFDHPRLRLGITVLSASLITSERARVVQ